MIILKRMKDALKDDDRILAALEGTSVGQDGRTNGIMAPNWTAQEMVARNAYVQQTLIHKAYSTWRHMRLQRQLAI